MDPDWAALEAAWLPARRAGVLGSATTEELREHAAGFIPAACGVLDSVVGIDLGSGAGIPGLLLAVALPHSRWTLVDGSERRCEFALSAVRALSLQNRVEVRHGRAEELAHDASFRASYSLVVARLFGPPSELAEIGIPFVTDGGTLAVSVTAETTAVWRAGLARLPVRELECRKTEAGSFLHIQRSGPVDASWPRRQRKRQREPLLPS
ncbi:MAG: 16S rRNA (guanine527-N7)-methyltransferase [Candidatus Aldehydirespiratoraceae bacterium]|jgi:16S rRNA (guanine527-N7)-methyltransferase